MEIYMKRLWMWFFAWIGICAAGEQRIPLEVLYGNPERAAPKISPDGNFLAFLAPVDGVLNIWVRDLATGQENPITCDRHRGIQEYGWLYDNSSLFYVQDKDGDENWNLYAVDSKTRALRAITPFQGVMVKIAGYSHKHPDEMAIVMNKDDRALFDLYKIRLGTGAIELMEKNPGNVAWWFVDLDLNVAAYQVFNDDATVDIFNKRHEPLLHWTMSESMLSHVLGVSGGGKTLQVCDAGHSNTARLATVDVDTAEVTILCEDPRYDFGGIIQHPQSRAILAATIQRQHFDLISLDQEYAADFEALMKGLPERAAISLLRMSLDGGKWVAVASSDIKAPACYFYDRSSKEVSHLFDCYPELAKYEMAKTEPVAFNAQDGLLIEGYLTLPLKACKPSPMVLFVHGGPQARDEWGFKNTVQFLADRGYAVLQLNYRGSSGYGVAHLDAGVREWGGKMQDDLTDGVRWAIEQGIADPKRIAIFGASYGGYAALCGAAFTPDLYTAAIDFCGPSNLISFLNSIPPYWKMFKAQFEARLGDLEKDEELLKARSPLFSVDKIRTPMLIAQGANDPRVVEAESRQVAEALKERNIPCEYVVYPDEGHGFARPENRLDFYRRVEKFLAEHLGRDGLEASDLFLEESES